MSTHQPTTQMVQAPYIIKSTAPMPITATWHHQKIVGPTCGASTPSYTVSYSKFWPATKNPPWPFLPDFHTLCYTKRAWNIPLNWYLFKVPTPPISPRRYQPSLIPLQSGNCSKANTWLIMKSNSIPPIQSQDSCLITQTIPSAKTSLSPFQTQPPTTCPPPLPITTIATLTLQPSSTLPCLA